MKIADEPRMQPRATDLQTIQRAAGHRGGQAWDATKRTFDVAMALSLLLVLIPFFALVVVALRLDSRGPAIFRQQRRGRHGEPFEVLKFRTMHTGVSSKAHQEYIAALCSGEAGAGAELKKMTRDPRVTRVGAFLRRTSLDELPQLVNVARGQMSIVGPRPALDYELEHYDKRHFERFAVRPGLTGLWQVSGRSELGFQEMLDLDVAYARSAGPKLDAKILVRTPAALTRSKTA